MIINNDEHRYDYMLDMSRPVSKKRKPMSLDERAAQFGAFRALTGYEEVISETGRITEEKIELDEYYIAEINDKLQLVKENINSEPKISVVYFLKDEYKTGGAYVTHTGNIKKVQEYDRLLVFSDGKKICIDDILSVDISKND